MELKDILDMLSRGEITSEAANSLIDKLRSAVAGKVPDSDKKSYATLQDFMGPLTEVLEAVKKTPEGQAQIRDAVAGRKEQRFVKRYAPFFDAILAGADVLTSLSQIRDSKSAMRNLQRPALPAIPGMDPALEQGIRDAQIGTMDAARVAGPARQELQDQYAKDIAMAKA